MLLSGQKRSRGSAALAAESCCALDSNYAELFPEISERVSGLYNHPERVAAALIGLSRFPDKQGVGQNLGS
jgi:hypothetical protein